MGSKTAFVVQTIELPQVFVSESLDTHISGASLQKLLEIHHQTDAWPEPYRIKYNSVTTGVMVWHLEMLSSVCVLISEDHTPERTSITCIVALKKKNGWRLCNKAFQLFGVTFATRDAALVSKIEATILQEVASLLKNPGQFNKAMKISKRF